MKLKIRKKIFFGIVSVFLGLILALIISEVFIRLFITVRNVGPSFTVYDSVYGKRLKKDFSTTRITPEFKMKFTTNSLGFRGPEINFPVNSSIIFLGDSFSMGYGVNDG